MNSKIKNCSHLEKKSGFRSFLSKLHVSLVYPLLILIFGALLASIAKTFSHLESAKMIYDIFIGFFNFIINNFPILICLFVANTFFVKESKIIILTLLSWVILNLIQSLFIVKNDTSYSIWFYKNLPSTFFINNFTFVGLNLGIIFPMLFPFAISWLFSFFAKFKFTKYFGMFTGQGFAFILILLLSPIIALITLIVWPPILVVTQLISFALLSLPFGIDAFIFGFLNRFLSIFGYQIILLFVFNLSSLSGTLVSNGVVIAQGDFAIWHIANQLGIPFETLVSGGEFVYNGVNYTITNNTNPGQFSQGLIVLLVFCYPMIALVRIINGSTTNKRKTIFNSIYPMLTGVTETFEFTNIYNRSKIFFWFNCLISGLIFLTLDYMNCHIGIIFGGIIDFFLTGFVPIGTNFYNLLYVGLLFSGIYFVGYFFLDTFFK